MQARLQRDPDVAELETPQRLEDVDRQLRVLRALHVDADEELVPLRRLEDAPQVVHAGGAVDRQAELRQLERDVALDAGGDDGLDELHVVARGGRGGLGRAHALAEVVERHAAGPGRAAPGPRSMASWTVSPAMNRRANPFGVMPYCDARRFSVTLRASKENIDPPAPASASGGTRVEQVVDRACVVAEDVPIAHADATPVHHQNTARFERLEGCVNGVCTGGHAEVRARGTKRVEERVRPLLQLASGDRGPHGRGHDRRGQHLVEAADGVHHGVTQIEHGPARIGIDPRNRDRRAERDIRAGPVPHRIAHHLREFPAERPLRALHPLTGQHVILEDHVVRDRRRASRPCADAGPAAPRASGPSSGS